MTLKIVERKVFDVVRIEDGKVKYVLVTCRTRAEAEYILGAVDDGK